MASIYVPRPVAVGNEGRWLFELDLGQIFYVSTQPVVVLADDGEEFKYDGGLLDQSLPMTVDAGAETNITITISSSVPWAKLAARLLQMERRPAILYRWFVGQTREAARIHLEGITDAVSFAEEGEDLVLTLTQRPLGNSLPMPPAMHKIDTVSFPTRVGFVTDKTVRGTAYPMYFGFPGVTGVATNEAVVPAMMVEYDGPPQGGTAADNTNRVLIAGGRLDATDVTVHIINGAEEPVVESRPVLTALDNRGIRYSYFNFVGASNAFRSKNRLTERFFIGMDKTGGGGMLNDDRSGPRRGAGEIIRFIIDEFTDLQADHAMLATYEEALNAYKIDGFANEGTDAWDWLLREILPLLPVVAQRGPDGIWFQPINWGATKADAIAFLNADRRQVDRIGGLDKASGEVFNEFNFIYGPSRLSGRFEKAVTLTGRTNKREVPSIGEVDDVRIIESLFCRASVDAFGVRAQRPATGRVIWDDATASLIVNDRAAKLALPRRRGRYTGGSELESLPIWSNVAITDSEMGLDEAVALIEDIIVGPDEVMLQLLILDHPLLATRLAA